MIDCERKVTVHPWGFISRVQIFISSAAFPLVESILKTSLVSAKKSRITEIMVLEIRENLLSLDSL